MWDGKFVVKNAMEQACEIETNYVSLYNFYVCPWHKADARGRSAISDLRTLQ
jgi:hypothetical protein